MKKPSSSKLKSAKTKPAPTFQVEVRKRVTKSSAAAAAKPEKRDNIFSKSRDTREDRSARQMKNGKNAQTFSHGH